MIIETDGETTAFQERLLVTLVRLFADQNGHEVEKAVITSGKKVNDEG